MAVIYFVLQFELDLSFILDTIISIIIDIGGTGLKGKGMVKSTLEYNHKTFTDSVVLQAFFAVSLFCETNF